MKAARIHRFGDPEIIMPEDLPRRQTGQGELRIRAQTASINPVDHKIRQGKYMPEGKLPIILGRDTAGIADKCEPVAGVSVGTHHLTQPNGSQLLDIEHLTEEGRVRPYGTRNMGISEAIWF